MGGTLWDRPRLSPSHQTGKFCKFSEGRALIDTLYSISLIIVEVVFCELSEDSDIATRLSYQYAHK
ncbi:unnamed protein product [Prunus armeniaca]